jgi:hypothetical protein
MTLYSMRPQASTAIPTPKIGVIKPTTVVRAVSIGHLIGHGQMTPEQCNQGAADWLDGELYVLPSLTLAQSAFPGASYPGIVAARGQQGNRPKDALWLNLLARCWVNTSEAEHAIFASAYEAGLWRALEHVIDVQDDD